MPVIGRYARAGVIDRGIERGEVERWVSTLGIRVPSIERAVSQLSGGNQQKVVVARWMLANARVLIFDEPTRGIDIGAKAEIYMLMRELTAGGAAILMISSDLPEAVGMADRLIVMRQGRIAGELTGAAITQQAAGRIMLGEGVAA
jgi:ribose transport system ATP-binding protein